MGESRASRRWAILWAQVASEMHPDSSSQSWGHGAQRGWPGVGGGPVAERTAHHPLLSARTRPSLARAGTWAPGCSPMASPSWSPRCPLDGAVGGTGLFGRSQPAGHLMESAPKDDWCRLRGVPWAPGCVFVGPLTLFRPSWADWLCVRLATVAVGVPCRVCWRCYLWAAGRSICERRLCWRRCDMFPLRSQFMMLEDSCRCDQLLIGFSECCRERGCCYIPVAKVYL